MASTTSPLIRPKFLWHLAEPVIRRVAGLGEVNADAGRDIDYEHVNMYAEVAVVGGGPSGCSAALAASESGARVVIVDDQQSLGGHLRDLAGPVTDEGEFAGVPGYVLATELEGQLSGASNVTVLTGASAIGLYEGNLLAIHRGKRTHQAAGRPRNSGHGYARDAIAVPATTTYPA